MKESSKKAIKMAWGPYFMLMGKKSKGGLLMTRFVGVLAFIELMAKCSLAFGKRTNLKIYSEL